MTNESVSGWMSNDLDAPQTKMAAGVDKNVVIEKIEKLVSTIAEKEGYENFKVKTTPISTDGANYMGDLFLADVIEDGKDILHLFAKVANTPAAARSLIQANQVYQHEVYVYTTLANLYSEMQERHGVPEEKRFKFVKYYGSNLNDMDEILVLENIAAQGYILYDRFKPLDWEYARAALEELAKLHALSFAFKHENPEAFEKLAKNLPQFFTDEMAKTLMESMKMLIPMAVNAIESKNRDKVQKYIDETADNFLIRHMKSTSKNPIIVHGDYRASNILVKYENNQITSLKPVDYQTLSYNDPVNDIIYLLFTGTDEEFRKQHYDDFLEFYHSRLGDHLKDLSQNVEQVYPKSTFMAEVKEKLTFGLDVALSTLSAVLVDPKKVVTVEEMLKGGDAMAKMKPDDIYAERLNGIVRDFVRWGYLDKYDTPTTTTVQNTIMPGAGKNPESVRSVESFASTIAVKEGYKNFKLKTTPMSTDGANYLGDLFYVDVIQDGRETLNLFIKAANTPAHVRKIFPVNEIYTQEAFMYSTLAVTYHELQEKHKIPEEKRFKFPKYYGANLNDMEEMLALENLATQGFILYDRFKPVDWEYAKAAVEEIAKYHAMSFALQKENPDAFKKILEKLPDFSKGEEVMANYVKTAKQGIPLLMSVIETKNKSRVQKYLDDNEDQLMAKHFEKISERCAIIHMDYRASNIMVKYKGNDVVSLKPVDYQGGYYGCPVNDIIYFLFCGSDEEFRRQYFEKYVEHYHNSLADYLKLLSQDINEIYPKSTFYFELKEKMYYGLEVALFTLNIILVDHKTNNMTIEDMVNPEKIKEETKPSEQYVERLNGVIRDFVRWDLLEEGDTTTPAQEIVATNSVDGTYKTAEIVGRVEKFVGSIAQKEGFKNFKLKTTAMSTEGANYTSDLFYVDVIEDGKNSLNLFVKACNIPESLRNTFPVEIIFKQEEFIYATVANTYHELQERHNVPEQKRFKFPKYYGANLNSGEEMLALENLAAQGYILYDRFKPIDWEYAKFAVEEIAKFHALSFALQKENPDEFQKISQPSSDFKKAEEMFKNFIEIAKKTIPGAVSVIHPENKSRVQKYIDDNEDQLLGAHFELTTKHNALIHADFRASNIMVKYQGNDVIALKPVDYQGGFYGSPINDILYFLFLGSDEEFRRQYFESYIEHYHNSLAAHLKLLSQDINEIYPKSTFYFELKEKMYYGLEVALLTLSLVLIDPKANMTLEDIMNPEKMKEGSKPSEQYVERLNGVVRDFVRWGLLDEGHTTASPQAITISVDGTNNVADVVGKIEKFVGSIALKEGFKNFKLKTTPMSTEGANYTSDLFYVDVIEDGKNSLNLFVKVCNIPESVRDTFPVEMIFKHEEFIYTTVANAYHALQERHNVPEQKRFIFPKYYGANLNHAEEMLVLENLAAQGYILYDRFKPVDWEYAKVAVEEIAKFHALSFALQKENPNEFQKISQPSFDVTKLEEIMKKQVKDMMPLALSATHSENKSRVQKYIEDNQDKLFAARFKPNTKHNAFIHTDFRASNIMVKYQGNNVVSLKPVDYQGGIYGCPINDILYFLFLGSDEEFRRQYFERYIEHYHNSLAAHLKLLSHDIREIYPKSTFYFELKEQMYYGLEVALTILNVVLIDPKSMTIEDLMNPDKVQETKHSEQYVERLNGVVRDFVRWNLLGDDDCKAAPGQEIVTATSSGGMKLERSSPVSPAIVSGNETVNVVHRIESFVSTIAKKEGFDNFKLKTTPISTEGANYMANLYYVDVTENGKETLNLFIKSANTPPHLRNIIPTNAIYKHEAFMYTTFAETYHELQERHKVPEEIRFKFPKYYGANLNDMEEILVLENLAAQDYILYDRFKPVDWEYAKAAVGELAKFHAMSFALQKENPDAFKTLYEQMPDFSENEDMLNNFVETGKKSFPEILTLVEPENRRSLQKYLDDNKDRLMAAHYKATTKHSAFIHSDFRASNILVKYQGSTVVGLKPVDYQSSVYGCPIADLLNFLFLGSDEEFRRQYFDDYLEHYHNSLAAHLKLLSQDVNEIYPKSAFYFDTKDRIFCGLDSAVLTLHIVLVDTQNPVTVEDMLNPDKPKTSTKYSVQYVERLNGIVRDFLRWGFLEKEDALQENATLAKANGNSDNKKVTKTNQTIVKQTTKKKSSCCSLL